VFVIDTSGRVGWSHVSQRAGDHPQPDEVVAAVRALQPSGSKERRDYKE
jgi:hypothetical protein